MITVKTNINKVVNLTETQLKNLANTDKMLRACATTVLGLMKTRIHENGLDADGKQIGTYSKGYMVLRTGAYQNAERKTKGKDKGALKNAGVFTKKKVSIFTQEGEDIVTEKKGFVKIGHEKKARPRYNRSSDTTVILSLTRQMENDEKVVATSGGYGIGFTNALNYQKSQWLEAKYKRKGKIFSLSDEEIKAVEAIAEKHLADALS